MPELPRHFKPDQYDNPAHFALTLNAPGVVAIGNALDSDTFKMIEEIAERRGRKIGHMMLRRKDLGSDGRPALDHFPVYTETHMSIIGDYVFEGHFGVEVKHVEEAEELIFGRAEFADLTEEQRRRNVIRLAFNAAQSDLSEMQEDTLIPLIGGQFAVVTGVINDGVKTRDYNLLSEDDPRLDPTA
jgi:hypothetical protein